MKRQLKALAFVVAVAVICLLQMAGAACPNGEVFCHADTTTPGATE